MPNPDAHRLVPDCRISLAGKKLDLDKDARLTKVDVDLAVDLFGQCTLLFNDPKLALINGQDFKAGAQVKVEIGFGAQMTKVFEGEVVALEPQFRRDLPPSLRIVCQESIHRLALKSATRALLEVDTKEIASKIAQEHGLTAEAPSGTKEHVLQPNVSDSTLLRRVAATSGNHLRIEGKKLVIGPPPKRKDITVAPGDGLKKMRVRIKAAEQIGEVSIHGWDPKTKKEIVGKAKGEGETGEGSKKHGANATLSFAGDEHIPADVATAEAMAKGRMRKLAEGFVSAQVEMIGNADVQPGALITFDKMGDKLDGKYRVEKAHHDFSKRGYWVTASAVRIATKKPPAPGQPGKAEAQQREQAAAREERKRARVRQGAPQDPFDSPVSSLSAGIEAAAPPDQIEAGVEAALEPEKVEADLRAESVPEQVEASVQAESVSERLEASLEAFASSATGLAAGAVPDRKPAPAHLQGVGSTAEKPDEKEETKKWVGETLLSGLEKGLDLAGEVLSKTKSDPDASLRDVVRDVLVDAVEAEAWDIVEQVPFGKAIHITVELSQAFAEGVGAALDEVNKKLRVEYEQPIMQSGEVTEEDKVLIQNMCRYQARAVQELPGILEAGLDRVKDKAIEMLKKKAMATAAKVVGDLCGQVAKQLIKRNDLLAAWSERVASATEKIPEGRREGYAICFHFVSNLFVEELGGEKLKAKLQPLLKAPTSKAPIDVAILSGLIEILVRGSYKEYAKHVDVDGAASALEEMLLDQGGKVVDRLEKSGLGIGAGSGDRVEKTGSTVAVPQVWKQRLESRGPVSEEARSRWVDRQEQFQKFVNGLQVLLRAKQRSYQHRIDAAAKAAQRRGEPFGDELWKDLSDKLYQSVSKAKEKAIRARQQVIGEFGEVFDGQRVVDHFFIKLPPGDGWPGALDGAPAIGLQRR